MLLLKRIYLLKKSYTVSQKNKTLHSCPQLPKMLTDVQNSFTDRLSGKFATK